MPSSVAPRRTPSRPPRMRLRRDSAPPAAAMARLMVPPNSMRSGPSSRSTSTARAWVAPQRRWAAAATSSASAGVISAGGGEARGDQPAREGLHQGEGRATRAKRLEDHALHRLVVLGEDEVAQAL